MSYLPGSQSISNTNKRVGINTLTPTTDLDINGALKSTTGQIGSLTTTNLSTSNLTASTISGISTITATNGTITNLSSTNGTISTLVSTTGTIGSLTTSYIQSSGSLMTLKANEIKLDDSVTKIGSKQVILNANGDPDIFNAGIIISQPGIDGSTTGAYMLTTSSGWTMKSGLSSIVTLNQDVSQGSNPSFTDMTLFGSLTASTTGTFSAGLYTPNANISTLHSNSVTTSYIQPSSGDLTISGSNINIGAPGNKVNIQGDLTYINTTVTEITDSDFVLNVGNPNINGAGILISQTGFDGARTGAYALVNDTSDGWVFKAGGGPTIELDQDIGRYSSPEFTDITLLGTITGQTGVFSNLSATTGTITNLVSDKITMDSTILTSANNLLSSTTALYVPGVSYAMTGVAYGPTGVYIYSSTTGSPYPAAMQVSNQLIYTECTMSVILAGCYITSPSTIRILLSAPNGKSILLMSDLTVISHSGANVNLMFTDNGSNFDDSLHSGTYIPTGTTSGNMPSPAPIGPYVTTLAQLTEGNINGEWNLYVYNSGGANPQDVINYVVLQFSLAQQSTIENLNSDEITTGILNVSSQLNANNINAQGTITASTGVFNNGLTSVNGRITNLDTDDIYFRDTLVATTGAHLKSYDGLVYAQSSTNNRRGIIVDTTNYATNVMLGSESIFSNVDSGTNNISIGVGGLTNITSGNENIAIGPGLYNLLDGAYNVAIGNYTLNNNVSGVSNIAVGYCSQQFSTQNGNTSIGSLSLNALIDGLENSAFGALALNTVYGSNNVGLGARAGNNLQTGSNNIFIGYNAGYGTTNSNQNIIISGDNTFNTRSGDNYLQIGNSIYGNNIYTAGNSQIGINKSNPSGSLDVSGTVIADTFVGTIGQFNNLAMGSAGCPRKWYSYSSAFSSTTGPLQLTFAFANNSFVANVTSILNTTGAVNDMSVAECKVIGGTQDGSVPSNNVFVSNHLIVNNPSSPAISWTGAYPSVTPTTYTLSTFTAGSNMVYSVNVEVIKGTLVSISDNDSPTNNTITFTY